MITAVQTWTGHEAPAFIDPLGIPRILGRTFSNRPQMAIQPFADAPGVPVIDLAKIPAYDRWQANIPILDQGQIGSCTAHGLASAMMKARDLANYAYIPLGPTSLYAQINGGRDQGSNPSDGITALQQNGICTLADVPDTFIRWESISSQAKDTAKRFRVVAEGVYTLSNFAEIVTADYLGWGVCLTINVGNNFNPGTNGIVGYAPGMANHCVSGGEGFQLIGGQPAYRFRNSWTTRWGVNGCGWFTARYIDQQPQMEAFAIKWTLADPLDPNNPPQGV